MKKKFLGLLVVGFILFNLAAPGTGNAAVWAWTNCEQIGQATGANPMVYLTTIAGSPTTFTQVWFTLPADKANQMMAMAMTAQSSGLHLWVQVDGITGGNLTTMNLTN